MSNRSAIRRVARLIVAITAIALPLTALGAEFPLLEVPPGAVPSPSIAPDVTPPDAGATSANELAAIPGNWMTDFQEAVRMSRLSNRPVLLRSVLEDCPPCVALEETLKDGAVAQRLGEFILYKLDMDVEPDQARVMGVIFAPTMRVIAPTGVLVAEQRGFMEPKDLLAWLDQSIEMAQLLTPAKVAADPRAVIPMLGKPDPVMRELATQALMALVAAPRNTTLRGEVVERFVEGNLAMRLGILELLRQTGAPVAGVDPWKPDTVVAAQDALIAWAAGKTASAEGPRFDRDEIERDLQFWIAAEDGADARACYERLARSGRDLLPRVKELMPETWSLARERLAALQYRLLMPPAMAAEHPETPFQMAARDPDVRMRAVDNLANAARAKGEAGDMEPFFLQVFSDPDARVREASLRGLKESGVALAKQQVLKLLEDPSPNVRAGILNDLAASPLPELSADLKAYALSEQDPDLVVHAARALRRIRTRRAAFEGLIALTTHPSWRVRAEAVEAMGETSTWSEGLEELSPEQMQEVAVALAKVLRDEDAFVVAKGMDVMENMRGADLGASAEALISIAQKHSALAEKAIQLIARQETLRGKAIEQIKALCRNESPVIRAAAISALVVSTKAPMKAELLTALADESAQVRTAAARSVGLWLDNLSGELDGSIYSIPSFNSRPSGPVKVEEVIPEDIRMELVTALRKNMSAQDRGERFASLAALGALNDIEVALPGIENEITAHPDLVTETLSELRQLSFDNRKRIFETVRGLPVTDDAWGTAFEWMFGDAPSGAETYFWEVFEIDPHVVAVPNVALEEALSLSDVEGGLWYRESDAIPAENLAKIAERARKQLQSDNPKRNVLGHILLLRVRPDEGAAAIKAVLDAHERGESVDDVLYTACLEMYLAGAGNEKAPPPVFAQRTHTLVSGDTLYSLAEKYYGDGQKWRVIAEANNLTASPANLKTGAVLTIPDPDAPPVLGVNAEQLAVRLLQSEREDLRSIAFASLGRKYAISASSRPSVHVGEVTVYAGFLSYDSDMSLYDLPRKQWEPPALPEELTPALIRRFLKSDSPEERNIAAFLLALKGDDSGFPTLLESWRNSASASSEAIQLARTIAALNRDEDVRYVAETFEKLDGYDRSTFGAGLYWSIRRMDGEKAKELRRKMREELGSVLMRGY